MQTYLISGGVPLRDDRNIWIFVSQNFDLWRPSVGEPLRIALLGVDDLPYRVIIANGSDEFDLVCSNLRDIGLTAWGGFEPTLARVYGTEYAAVFGSRAP